MGYCGNCGAFVGENRFCANCGAAVQGNVNAASNNQPPVNTYINQPPVYAYTNQPVYPPNVAEPRSPYYDQVMAYHRAVRSYYAFGLLSLLLCMGIGSIFQLICFIKTLSLSKYNVLFENRNVIKNYPREWEILGRARSKFRKSRTMFIIGTILTSILYIILIVSLMFGY